MDSLSDPSRAGRGDKQQAQQKIDAALAAGRLTSADHELRSQRVAAAQTTGDLAALTRDLPEAESLGSAIDPAVLESMRVQPGMLSSTAGSEALARRTINLSGKGKAIKRAVLAFVLGTVLLCGLGIAGMVFAVFHASSDSSHSSQTGGTSGTAIPTPTVRNPAPNPTAGLLTAAGWKSLVDAVKSESGTTEVYDAVVYPDYAALGMVSGDGMVREVFRDGAFLTSVKVQTPAVGNRVDLASIEPAVLARLPQQVADDVGMTHPTGTYLIVNALPTAPRITVYVQADGASEYRTFTLDGTPAS